jgi:hypothetical protein
MPGAGGERTVDSRTPFLPHGGRGLPTPCVSDVSEQSLRQREMNFAVKKLADIGFVSGLDWPDVLGCASMS